MYVRVCVLLVMLCVRVAFVRACLYAPCLPSVWPSSPSRKTFGGVVQDALPSLLVFSHKYQKDPVANKHVMGDDEFI